MHLKRMTIIEILAASLILGIFQGIALAATEPEPIALPIRSKEGPCEFALESAASYALFIGEGGEGALWIENSLPTDEKAALEKGAKELFEKAEAGSHLKAISESAFKASGADCTVTNSGGTTKITVSNISLFKAIYYMPAKLSVIEVAVSAPKGADVKFTLYALSATGKKASVIGEKSPVNGVLSFKGVKPGKYALSAEPIQGFLPASTLYINCLPYQKPSFYSDPAFKNPVPPTAQLAGQTCFLMYIYDASSSKGAKTPEGVKFILYKKDQNGKYIKTDKSASPDEDGLIIFKDLGPGSYRCSLEAAKYQMAAFPNGAYFTIAIDRAIAFGSSEKGADNEGIPFIGLSKAQASSQSAAAAAKPQASQKPSSQLEASACNSPGDKSDPSKAAKPAGTADPSDPLEPPKPPQGDKGQEGSVFSLTVKLVGPATPLGKDAIKFEVTITGIDSLKSVYSFGVESYGSYTIENILYGSSYEVKAEAPAGAVEFSSQSGIILDDHVVAAAIGQKPSTAGGNNESQPPSQGGEEFFITPSTNSSKNIAIYGGAVVMVSFTAYIVLSSNKRRKA